MMDEHTYIYTSSILGKGEVETFEPLGARGATSLAYRVRMDGRDYFMKQLRPELKSDWRYRAAYHKEYEVGRSLGNEYIVGYKELGENAEGMYILMEYVYGMTLDEKLAQEPEYFTKGKNFEKLFVQLLEAMKVLHDANVAYMDLSPDNVLLTQVNNDVRIVDLGFCFADAYGYTAGCTKGFAAPELQQGDIREVDSRTDIYAVGQLMKYVKEVACVSVPKRLQRIMDKCMRPAKQERYANVAEVLKDVRRRSRWILWSCVAVTVVTLFAAGYNIFSKTDNYRVMLLELNWLFKRPDYDIYYERNYYRILSHDSLTCMAVGGKRLENLYIHDRVYANGKEYRTVAIDSEAFGGRGIKSVYIPDGVVDIGFKAFGRCDGILSLSLPESVVKIGASCFESLSALRNLQLSGNIKEIPEKAFAKCTSLKKLDIPEGVEVLGFDAFAICTALEEVRLPSTLTAINRGVFWRCTSLKEISIPASVSVLGEYLFYDCDSLRHVYNYSSVPQRIPPIFNREGITLHVPKGSEVLYRQADHWNVANVVGDL